MSVREAKQVTRQLSLNKREPILVAHATAESLQESIVLLHKLRIENPVCCVNTVASLIDYLQGVGPYRDRSNHPVPSLVLLDAALAGARKWISFQSTQPVRTIVKSEGIFDLVERINMSPGILLKRTRTGHKVEKEAL